MSERTNFHLCKSFAKKGRNATKGWRETLKLTITLIKQNAQNKADRPTNIIIFPGLILTKASMPSTTRFQNLELKRESLAFRWFAKRSIEWGPQVGSILCKKRIVLVISATLTKKISPINLRSRDPFHPNRNVITTTDAKVLTTPRRNNKRWTFWLWS